MTPETFDCATCGSTTHHTIACDPLPQSATPRPLVMPCSRCGMSAVYNPRPGEDLVVCGDCGYEMGQATRRAATSPDSPAYMSIQRFLDKVLGENEDDGAGYGIEGDIRLAVAMAWEQGYLRGVLDSEGDLERADNPYSEDVPA